MAPPFFRGLLSLIVFVSYQSDKFSYTYKRRYIGDDMELTQEQLDAILAAVLKKAESRIAEIIANSIKELKLVTQTDLKDLASRQEVATVIADLKTSVSTDIAKTNEQVNKIARETETKIKALQTSPPAIKKSWFDRDII